MEDDPDETEEAVARRRRAALRALRHEVASTALPTGQSHPSAAATAPSPGASSAAAAAGRSVPSGRAGPAGSGSEPSSLLQLGWTEADEAEMVRDEERIKRVSAILEVRQQRQQELQGEPGLEGSIGVCSCDPNPSMT
jgi:hypothetical protein